MCDNIDSSINWCDAGVPAQMQKLGSYEVLTGAPGVQVLVAVFPRHSPTSRRTSDCSLAALPISSAPSIRPTPTLPPTAPIAFAEDGRHNIGDTAFDAGTDVRDRGGRGVCLAVSSGAVRRTLAFPPVQTNELRRVGGEVAIEDLV